MSPTDAERERRWNTLSEGPWEWVQEDEGMTLYDPRGVPVVDTHERGVTDGNRRLIAAAPDLLAALEAAWPGLSGQSYERPISEVWEQARTAIAKARGT